jgi:hypothetical protein
MNPVHHFEDPTLCIVCRQEDQTTHALWHRPLSVSHRKHSACLDCVSMICHKALKESETIQVTVACPECRKITRISHENAASAHLIVSSLVISIIFFVTKLALEPMASFYLQRILFSNFNESVEKWYYFSKEDYAWPLIQKEIDTLIDNGQVSMIINQIKTQIDLEHIAGYIWIVAAFFYVAKQLFQEGATISSHKRVFIPIAFQTLFYLAFTYFHHHSNHLAMNYQKDHLRSWMHPLKPHGHVSNIIETSLNLLAALLPMVANLYFMKLNVSFDFPDVNSFKDSLLKGKINFEETA